MKQSDVQTGGIYSIQVGKRLARVTVVRRVPGSGRRRFECRFYDSGLSIVVTAARLRLVAQSPQAKLVPPSVIPGVRLNAGRVIERMERFNSQGIVRAAGGIHVGLGFLGCCREFMRMTNRRSLRVFPAAFRRGAIHCLLAHHSFNRQQFLDVMQHSPTPSEEMIAAAMLGNSAARAAVLA